MLIRFFSILLLTHSIFSFGSEALDDYPNKCSVKAAHELFKQGYTYQANMDTDKALAAYKNCIKKEEGCVACHYEIGWSYWKQGDWKEVLYHWNVVLAKKPKHKEVNAFIKSAKANLNNLKNHNQLNSLKNKTPLLTQSKPLDSKINLTLIKRFQSYNKKTDSKLDEFDGQISSPKSVLVNSRNDHTYVNSLENYKTLVYDNKSMQLIKVIQHKFDKSTKKIFVKPKFKFDYPAKRKELNIFEGKPVESALTHDGKYLWVSYYRRSYDPVARYSSAVALIDTDTYKIIKVFPTASIPKYIEASPNGHYLAVGHWGENTILLINIKNKNPEKFFYDKLLTVEKKYIPKRFVNRDKDCGFCVRGLTFSNDDQYLFVARMKREGIQVFQLNEKKAIDLGAVMGHCRGPRDLQTSPDGTYVYASCMANGLIMKVEISKLVSSLVAYKQEKEGPKRLRLSRNDPDVKKVYVGIGTRSLKISPDGDFAFVSANQTSEVVVIETKSMNIISKIVNDSYPVGLDISPDGSLLWTTSQSRRGIGGNSINVYHVRYRNKEALSL